MKKIFIFSLIGFVIILLITIAYMSWNSLDPVHTCAQCHEIKPSLATWHSSAHAGISCTECHGTALSEGVTSLKEKSRMIAKHYNKGKNAEDIRLKEEQVMLVFNNCIRCHQAEHAGWLASGHAANYREIFLNIEHNRMEKPYWDCFRCHGMFYDGNINDLMNFEGDPSTYTVKNSKQEQRPTIPCLACHQMHTENPVLSRYVSTQDTAEKAFRNPRTALYVRSDKMHLRSDKLTPVVMKDNDRTVNRAIDPNTRLCQQCHAPNYVHQAGSQDDRTPIGVHEGISCTACHKVHTNDTRESCTHCHSEVSPNCKMDVRQMNTTYLTKNSPNDIHRISCTSCHEKK